ncbi:MAG: heme b synthase [Candidatus Hydrothermarchaeales archaeon]
MKEFLPRLIAWEVTGRCNLNCVHCRASASSRIDPNELSLEEITATIDNITSFCNPILILTGGEPLVRKDVFDIARYGTDKGMRVVVGTNGTLLTPSVVKKLMDAGVKRVSISIDCAYAEEHDSFRGMKGAYERSLKGIEACKEAGLEFQINTTVTKRNLDQLEHIFDQVVKLGAVAHHIFLLVPTGRGKALEDEEILPKEYERVLNWMYDMQKKMDSEDSVRMFMKATCAPHFIRVIQQRSKEDGSNITLGRHGLDAITSGCMAGTAFCFISRYGEVNTCGYLPVKAGNIREQSFKEIWENSKLFNDLRDRKNLKGKCGACEYKVLCSGCRARAYARYNDYLAEEPYCVYQPKHA